MPVVIKAFRLTNTERDDFARDLASVVPLDRDEKNLTFKRMRSCALGVIAAQHLPKGALVELQQQYRTRMNPYGGDVPVVLIHNLPTKNPALYDALAGAGSIDNTFVPDVTAIQDSVGNTTQTFHMDKPDRENENRPTASTVILGCVSGGSEHITTDFTANKSAKETSAGDWNGRKESVALRDGDAIVFPNLRLLHARHNQTDELGSNKRLLKAYDVFHYEPLDGDWKTRVRNLLPRAHREVAL